MVIGETFAAAQDGAEAVEVDYAPLDADHRSARGGEARRAAGVAGGAGQHRGRLGRACGQSRRDGGEGGRGDEVRRACRAHLARASAHQRRLDGAARRHRELRCGQRQLSAPRLLAGRARHARLDGRRDGHSAGENPRHHRGGRRRVRAQDRPLSGIHRHAGRRQEDRPAGVLDVGPQRILRQRQPRPRRLQRRRAGARRQGQVPGAAHPPSRQHGRLHRRGRRQHPDRQHDALPARHVRHQADRRADQMRVHQHHPDRALSRRRPPRGELLPGARGGRGRARHRHRPDQAAAEEPDFTKAMPYKTAIGTTYDSGDFATVVDKGLALADYDGFKARKKEVEEEGHAARPRHLLRAGARRRLAGRGHAGVVPRRRAT